MYFKKLELLGFKSFAEKTTLHFEPGITAVVGPNGCGKSNVFDSIRWVLGEQSVKSLRGSKMEDVIFNGTENIPALGYAEVSLTFSNETKALPIEYDEVTITRRLYRSGESEYLLNKIQVRLKDITELILGTGIGAESYSLVEQGKIDLILSSRPEDRRVVFDEAAGISKYKSQKRETLRKLEDTDANLLRVNDIITEVKRQINSLERQAAKARRYKEVFERLKEIEGAMAAYQLNKHKIQISELSSQLNQLLEQEKQDNQDLSELNRELNKSRDELNDLETALDELRTQANNADNAISINSQQQGFNQERIAGLKSRITAIDGQKRALQEKIVRDEEKIQGFKATLSSLLQELEGKKALETNADAELEGMTTSINNIQANLKSAKSKVLEYAAQEAAIHNQLQKSSAQFNQAIARKKRLDIEKIKAAEELIAISQNLKSAQEAEETCQQEFLKQKEACQELNKELNNSIQEKEGLTLRLQNLENELAALESQKEFLSSLKLRYENISESSPAVIYLDSLSDEKISGLILKVETIEKTPEAKYKAAGLAKPISLDPQEIINKIAQLKSGLEEIKSGIENKTSLINSLNERLSASEGALREAELEYNTRKNKRENISQHNDKLKEEFEIIALDAQEVNSQLESLSAEEKLLNDNLLKVKEASQANQLEIEQASEEISQKNNLRENILLNLTQLRTEISSFQGKISSCQETQKILEDAWTKDKAARDALSQEEEGSSKRISELETASAELARRNEGLKEQKAAQDKEISLKTSSLGEIKNRFRCLQEDMAKRKDILDSAKAKIHQIQMQTQEVTFLENGILERMEQVYKIGRQDIQGRFKEDFKTEETSQEITQLKQKIESYGQVNLVAIEEFDELRQRFDFLTSQQADLVKSKESLHEAILKINRTTKKMFLETFEKLVVEFKNYFRLLFGGGDAQLFLTDEQDPLESGIEIICRPPGKKLQNVLLLSGGEKSMSAIALLFAIFKVKPSPFCVLDEIDAALDEANVDRFSRMLVDFTSQSQFIVITHNKKTIANANIMYGITMEKAGISKIVSVKLAQKKEPSPESAQAAETAETANSQ